MYLLFYVFFSFSSDAESVLSFNFQEYNSQNHAKKIFKYIRKNEAEKLSNYIANNHIDLDIIRNIKSPKKREAPLFKALKHGHLESAYIIMQKIQDYTLSQEEINSLFDFLHKSQRKSYFGKILKQHLQNGGDPLLSMSRGIGNNYEKRLITYLFKRVPQKEFDNFLKLLNDNQKEKIIEYISSSRAEELRFGEKIDDNFNDSESELQFLKFNTTIAKKILQSSSKITLKKFRNFLTDSNTVVELLKLQFANGGKTNLPSLFMVPPIISSTIKEDPIFLSEQILLQPELAIHLGERYFSTKTILTILFQANVPRIREILEISSDKAIIDSLESLDHQRFLGHLSHDKISSLLQNPNLKAKTRLIILDFLKENKDFCQT